MVCNVPFQFVFDMKCFTCEKDALVIVCVVFGKREYLLLLFSFPEITGNPNVGFSEEDLEGDFDASKYDQAMQVRATVLKIREAISF